MRILVLRGGALGDFVVTLPMLGLLRARWPAARIELVGNERAAAVAVGRFYLDAAHAQGGARWARLGAGDLRPDEPLGAWLRAFDLIVNLWPDADGSIVADLARLRFAPAGAGATKDAGSRVFVSHPAAPARAPASAHYCDALAALGLAAAAGELAPRVYPGDDDRKAAAVLLGRGGGSLVAWHPGSGSPRKNWPIGRWLEVLASLGCGRGRRLAVVLGEADEGAWREATASGFDFRDLLVLRQVEVPVLAAVFARCDLFLGHDSGPAHLAAAAGCRCVLVFGPTDPAMWAPPHEQVRVVRGGADVADARVSDLLAAIGGS